MASRYTLLPFVTPPVCVKCGSHDIGRTYHAAGVCAYGCRDDHEWFDAEHHRLNCRGCGYAWQTRVQEPSA